MLLRSFNALQIICLFVVLPYITTWLYTAPFPFSTTLCYTAATVYVIMFVAGVAILTDWMTSRDKD